MPRLLRHNVRPDIPAGWREERPAPPPAAKEPDVKAGLHPVYKPIRFKCVCGNIIETRSAIETAPASDGFHHLEICASCHPFYTGHRKFVDAEGRVQRFAKKYGLKV